MKKFLAVALALVLAVGFVPSVQAAEGTIVVQGMGAINITPDIAYVTVGVETRDADPRLAQAENNAAIQAVLDAMADLGIEESDMQTVGFFMWPMIDHGWGAFDQPEPNRILGYVVTNNVEITVRDIDLVGDVLSMAVEAGANTGGGVRFSVQDSSEAYNQALRMAIQNANQKAQTIASALGRPLGAAITVMERGGAFMPMSWHHVDMMGARAMAGDMGVTPVQAGELTVSATVEVTFRFTP
jgi:uncharacterized protein YggE